MGRRIVTRTMIESCAELFSVEELDRYRLAAAKALLENVDRVVMTSSNMRDSGYTGQFIEGDPEFILALVKAAKKWKLNDAEGNSNSRANSSMSHVDLSRRPVGW